MGECDLRVAGFKFGAVKAGIRGKDRLDLGLICADRPASAAGVFTTNQVKAAPVLLDQERIKSGRAQAILVNSGIANACTGAQGLALARLAAGKAASALGIDEELVQVSSTGVIGQQLDPACFEHIPRLAAGLSPELGMEVARAIMTTDTVPKTARRTVAIGGATVTLAGMAKGSGMIQPNMATMLAYILTDATVAPALLREMLGKSVSQSFNRITVDGDTSTNDTVLLLASGQAGNPEISDPASPEAAQLQAALDDLTRDLALQIVADGEGATKLATIQVEGAQSQAEAEQAARTVANSPLVKTAFFGQDANWGRIIAALGRSGVEFEQDKVDIAFDQAAIVKGGLWLGPAAEAAATKVLGKKSFTVYINLWQGSAACAIHTCDLSLDYVKINADYRS
ncbi:MAG: bifunctional glutamate N-acetyltransferase/amino-acid acetyltransferase ArgJ [Desulfobacteraceae bacterium]|nr:bifunctional glutamate N-acetyltransferase/amino-acid acetyltransferase ArgJ [Desulfobacteraceae bacterium]